SRAEDQHQASSPRRFAGSSCRRSSVVLPKRGWCRNQTLPESADDHRHAARSLQRCQRRAHERLRHCRATPPDGTRPTSTGSSPERLTLCTDAVPVWTYILPSSSKSAAIATPPSQGISATKRGWPSLPILSKLSASALLSPSFMAYR